MAGTSDIYSWLYNPQLYYDPRTQSYRTPGFSQATWWEDPTPVRAVTPIRADPTVTPTPPDNSAAAALRGVFASRPTTEGGSPNGGDIVAGVDPLGGYGLAPDGGYGIPIGDIGNEFSPFGTPDQGWAERLAGMAIGAVPGVLPGVGNMVGRAMDFSPGPTAQRDFGRIGALAQREAEQGIPFSQADDPFAEGDLPNSELGWGLAERAAYDMGDRFRGTASPQQVGGPPTPFSLSPARPNSEVINATVTNPSPAKDAWTDLPAQDKSNPRADTPSISSTQGGDKAGDASGSTAADGGGKVGGGDVSASTSADGGKGDVSGSTGYGGDKGGDNGSGAGSEGGAGGGKGADASAGGDVSGSSSADAGGGYGGDGNSGGGGYGGGGDSGKGGGGDAGGSGGDHGYARGGPVRKPKGYRGPNPPGPDNMVGGLQSGEYVIPRSLTQGIQAGDPGSAMAALQGVRSGAPPQQPPPRAGGAMAAMHSVKGGKKKPPTRPAR